MAVAKKVARVGDITTGHDGYPPVHIVTGYNKFRVNGVPIALVGSQCELHNQGGKHPNVHMPIVSQGSPFFKVDGIPIARVGDEVHGNCDQYRGSPHTIATGSDFLKII